MHTCMDSPRCIVCIMHDVVLIVLLTCMQHQICDEESSIFQILKWLLRRWISQLLVQSTPMQSRDQILPCWLFMAMQCIGTALVGWCSGMHVPKKCQNFEVFQFVSSCSLRDKQWGSLLACSVERTHTHVQAMYQSPFDYSPCLWEVIRQVSTSLIFHWKMSWKGDFVEVCFFGTQPRCNELTSCLLR